MKRFEYAVADTLDGAVAAHAAGWIPKAGGVDLIDRLAERIEPGERVVSIAPLGALRGITVDDSGVQIGALATLQTIGEHPALRAKLPAVAHAAAEAATPQVRAVATLGGNLCQRPRCWYFRAVDYPCFKKGGSTCYAVAGESAFHAVIGGGPCHIVHPSNVAPALVAAEAVAHVQGPAGRRAVPAGKLFVLPARRMDTEVDLRPGELITRVEVARPPVRSAYVEIRQKQSFDWPLASCAVADHGGGRWRVVLGAVAPVPWVSLDAERVLAGHSTVTPALASRAAKVALKGALPMKDNGWRVQLAEAAVARALLRAVARPGGGP